MKCLQIIQEINPDNSDMWQFIGLRYRTAKEYDEAIKCFRRAVEIDDDVITESLLYLLALLYGKGDYEDSEKFFQNTHQN